MYGILSLQLLVTTLFCMVTYSSQALQVYQVQHIALFYVAIILSVVMELSLVCCSRYASSRSSI